MPELLVTMEDLFPEPSHADRTEDSLRAFSQTLTAFFERYPVLPTPAGEVQPDVLRVEAMAAINIDADDDVWTDPVLAAFCAVESGVPYDELRAAYALIFL